MKIDLDQIRELLAVVSATEVTELTIEFGDQRITVKKSPPVLAETYQVASKPIAVITEEPRQDTQAPTLQIVPHNAEPKLAPEPPPSQAGESNGYIHITSPMVGTFYRASSPESRPFVDVGDHVAVGDTVCIIEAMKLMNDMPSEVSGKIVKVMVENGTTVEYGQPLFLIDPKG
ncbi:MAG: acetyl-CoA carboxylase biotin carboxyl carrier protein [Candidatus Obscuribacterales bacterium]|nr:acetyl-CoA carboxylase biotin carboxyl carrier protein [Candidatus Obscuribacterales bacterium]